MSDSRLGRGLDSLISVTGDRGKGPSVVSVPVKQVRANPDQPRREFSEESLAGLAASIRRHGVLQPIIVERLTDGYQLIAGERRLRASKLAEVDSIPALVLSSDGDVSRLELALVENIQREALTPLDEAAAYEALLAETGQTHEELARQLGKGRASVTNTLRLLELPDDVKAWLNQGRLSAGQARALLGAGDADAIVRLARKTVDEGWTVREVETRVRSQSSKRRRPPQRDASQRTYEDKLRRLYGTKVAIQSGPKGGVVSFEFYSEDGRDQLIHQLIMAAKALEASASAEGPVAAGVAD